jgi:selenocysteine lyase/cysteine desulfurase
MAQQSGPYQDSIHITNCCRNSHDLQKFAGEICADLQASEHTTTRNHNRSDQQDAADVTSSAMTNEDHNLILGLLEFAPSIYASIATLAHETLPFLQGGEMNHGFEYLGLDFILSYRNQHDPITYDDSSSSSSNSNSNNSNTDAQEPIAYLLEVNAPPSQDTATKLPHAEELHNDVLRDLLTLWVYPKVCNAPEICGGWYCVYSQKKEIHTDNPISYDATSTTTTPNTILPSKAAILNKIRWNLFERKQQKLMNPISDTKKVSTWLQEDNATNDSFTNFARSFFPYYQQDDGSSSIVSSLPSVSLVSQPTSPPKIFFENAGGTQVPTQVISSVSISLCNRNRSTIGTNSVETAKDILATILGASIPSMYTLHFGSNASTLLYRLALWYVQTNLLQCDDEIILMTENHVANVQPWLYVAEMVGAHIVWWDTTSSVSKLHHNHSIEDLLSTKTRIIAVSHASNILGQTNNINKDLRSLVNSKTNGYGHIIVDGVAYVPHRYAAIDELQVDWYVISCHKMFGPHLGVLCGRNSIGISIDRGGVPTPNFGIQMGTVNYEACEGVRGVGQYFTDLSAFGSSNNDTHTEKTNPILDKSRVLDVYRFIQSNEGTLVQMLLNGLNRSKKVRVVHDQFGNVDTTRRLPIVCFIHQDISSSGIVKVCCEGGVACRNGTFLSTERFQKEHSIDSSEGVVRFSMAHYNTRSEVAFALCILESIPGWM